ncbi:MAG: hypothetical protein JW714_01225 [Candidatus Omnitrophica bacterium]|nr:hypothetical protein [Candidatus Omnitrophota bacterium]
MSTTIKNKIILYVVSTILLAWFTGTAEGVAQTLRQELADGVVLNVHTEDTELLEGSNYPQEVLQAACSAYQEIVFNQGFNRQNYTFACASQFFAYDSDQTIDIYLTQVDGPYSLCQPQGGLEYQASIYLPADYNSYRERYNITDFDSELKASLTHELLHIITYSYNRNMETTAQSKNSITSERWDWYTEGLARYFEALVGYRDEFLSSGFRKNVGDKVMVYKGGVNYFLRYPDRPLNERKYDFALFWQYLHRTYGMEKIEQISSQFRAVDPAVCSGQQAMQIIADTLGVELNVLLQDFSLYLFEVSSLPAKKEAGLEAVSITKFLSSRNQRTQDSICSFGFDFYALEVDKGMESISLSTFGRAEDLNCLVGIYSPSAFQAFAATAEDLGRIKIDAREFPQGSKIILMLSNPTNQSISYNITLD